MLVASLLVVVAAAAIALLVRIAATGELANRPHVVVVEVDPDAALQAARQHHGAVADADQPAHRQADLFEEAPHLAIAPFGDDDPVPVVSALAAAVFDRAETRVLAVDADAFEQLGFRLGVERAQHPHRIFALDAEARVHQLVGELARVGEQQQAFGVQVEPTDRLPLALLQARQAAEHRRAVLRVVVRDDFADRLVVRDDAWRRRHDAHPHRLAVDLDVIAERDPLAHMSRLAVDGDLAVGDQLFHVAPRADAGLRQHLVQLRRFGVRAQHALRRRGRRIGRRLVFDVELARDHFSEKLVGVGRRDDLDRLGRRCRVVVFIVVVVDVGRVDDHHLFALCPCFATPAAALAAAPAPAALAAWAIFGAAFDRRCAVGHRGFCGLRLRLAGICRRGFLHRRRCRFDGPLGLDWRHRLQHRLRSGRRLRRGSRLGLCYWCLEHLLGRRCSAGLRGRALARRPLHRLGWRLRRCFDSALGRGLDVCRRRLHRALAARLGRLLRGLGGGPWDFDVGGRRVVVVGVHAWGSIGAASAAGSGDRGDRGVEEVVAASSSARSAWGSISDGWPAKPGIISGSVAPVPEPSSGGSWSRLARPRSSRNWRVVASSAGRPGASR